MLRPVDLNTSGPVWIYEPPKHKTAHWGTQRVIAIQPEAHDAIRPFLLQPESAHCFESPRRGGLPYTESGYYQAVIRGCKAAGIEPWCPSRLRHTFLTWAAEVLNDYSAAALAGHGSTDTTRRHYLRSQVRSLAEQLHERRNAG